MIGGDSDPDQPLGKKSVLERVRPNQGEKHLKYSGDTLEFSVQWGDYCYLTKKGVLTPFRKRIQAD